MQLSNAKEKSGYDFHWPDIKSKSEIHRNQITKIKHTGYTIIESSCKYCYFNQNRWNQYWCFCIFKVVAYDYDTKKQRKISNGGKKINKNKLRSLFYLIIISSPDRYVALCEWFLNRRSHCILTAVQQMIVAWNHKIAWTKHNFRCQ